MTRKSMGRVSTAGLSIAAVAALGFSATPLAFAQGEEDTSATATTSAAAPGNPAECKPQDNQKTSVTNDQVDFTIHKYKGKPVEPKSFSNDGKKLEADPSGVDKLSNVDFTVYKVEGIDLKTNAGQQLAAKLTAAYKAKGDALFKEPTFETEYPKVSVAKSGEVMTTKDGVVTKKFDAGLYLVKETKSPADVVPAKPFLVALPLTDQTNTACWNYDVHVYPKNAPFETGIKKSIKDVTAPGSGSTEASQYQYTVDTKIGDPGEAGFAKFQVIDPLAPELTYIGKGKDVVKIKDGEVFQEGTDYKIIAAEKQPGKATWVTIGFLEPGLTKLAANAGKEVEWTLNVQADELNGLKQIHNVASNIQVPKDDPTNPNFPKDPEDPNSPGDPEDPDPKNPPFDPETPPEDPTTPPGVPSNEVDTFYGKLEFTKVSTEGDAPLDGAKFQVFECNANREISADPATGRTADPVKVNGKDVFESTGGGKVVIDGLLVNDFRNNSTFVNGTDGTTWKEVSFYCLKETVAPPNHELLPDVLQFQLLANPKYGTEAENSTKIVSTDPKTNFEDQADAEKALKEASDIKVKNVPKNNGFNLPLTGGAGIAPLVVVGGLLIVGSGAYVAAASRRKKQA
ncbi:SpaH/EbpB family LPXTG-anchored major pilin [Corynebacterium aquilae]|uniref:Gram-positive pilin subunit D1 N-terminal domain-containing protein n=1 Tax=Corynebacterium aquilae DSM 44791 TaxID=1431546 RepID=A0A1L7CIM9_9CORY|nr:SpaH/EbpB family LPXTG-anchored major pilin [Corynebacterium aquilae]APT85712.1 hypothetical protein CAQU_12470 [Corynebacterium aquilae DSM 44791]